MVAKQQMRQQQIQPQPQAPAQCAGGLTGLLGHLDPLDSLENLRQLKVLSIPPQSKLTIKLPYIRQYLQCGFMIMNKYRIQRLIGQGGFGQIYRAEDVRYHITVAIKIGVRSLEPARMILEQKVLRVLSNTKHSPILLASGSFGEFMYIVMELLGRNLMDLRRSRPLRYFSVGTTLRIGQQCTDALHAIHRISFLHRDIKPSNICIGSEGSKRRLLYVVDFGMVRQFRDANGAIRNERRYAGFRGTTRYVSITVHNRLEQGPVDDFWSLLYSLIEIGEGSLPWRFLTDPVEVLQMKLKTRIEDMCRNLPSGIADLADHFDELGYDELPDYQMIKTILQKHMPNEITSDSPYDWE